MPQTIPAKTQLAALEAKWATGITRVDGRHVSEIGLVARDGSRRVFAGDDDDGWYQLHAGYLIELAREALSGRTATVFEGRVLDPLAGKPRRSIEDLAFQFGVNSKRIYKVLDDAKTKIMNLWIDKVANAGSNGGAKLQLERNHRPRLGPPDPHSYGYIVPTPEWLAFAAMIEDYWKDAHPGRPCPMRQFYDVWVCGGYTWKGPLAKSAKQPEQLTTK